MTSRCSRCGSTSFRADRSLGGRLVCTHCGTPADRRSRGSGQTIVPRRKGLGFWLLVAAIALVLVLVIQSI